MSQLSTIYSWIHARLLGFNVGVYASCSTSNYYLYRSLRNVKALFPQSDYVRSSAHTPRPPKETMHWHMEYYSRAEEDKGKHGVKVSQRHRRGKCQVFPSMKAVPGRATGPLPQVCRSTRLQFIVRHKSWRCELWSKAIITSDGNSVPTHQSRSYGHWPATASGPSLFCSGGGFRVLGQCFVIAW